MRPSGLNATHSMTDSWPLIDGEQPFRTEVPRPAVRYRRGPKTSRRPSGLNATHSTLPPYVSTDGLSSVRGRGGLAASQTAHVRVATRRRRFRRHES